MNTLYKKRTHKFLEGGVWKKFIIFKPLPYSKMWYNSKVFQQNYNFDCLTVFCIEHIFVVDLQIDTLYFQLNIVNISEIGESENNTLKVGVLKPPKSIPRGYGTVLYPLYWSRD